MSAKSVESPCDLIGSLDQLNAALNTRLSTVADETVEIVKQWDALGGLGAQRDDHAAELMARLLPGLRELHRYAGQAVKLLEGMKADPFGRKGGA